MRILIVDVTCNNGSTGKIAYQLYSRLNEGGDEAAVCYGRGRKIREKNIFKFGLDFETFLHAFLTRITGFTGCFSLFSTIRLIRFIKKFKPDVVHLHELHAYFVNITQLLNFLKKQDIRIVHTLHCTFSYTGKCGHHLNCDKWKTECGKCPRLHEYVSTFLFDHTRSMFIKKKIAFKGFNDMTIVCPSEWLASFARQSFLGQYPIQVIFNGIDTSIFCPRDATTLRKSLGIDDNKKVVLSVAPNLMSESKGGRWVLKIADDLKNLPFVFIMIGVENSKELFPSNVIAIKHLSSQFELSLFYSLADRFLFLSQRETFSLTCAESVSCGTPVIGFRCGAPETIFFSPTNHFYNYGDIASIEADLMTVLSNEHHVKNADNRFGLDSMFKNYCSIYYKK